MADILSVYKPEFWAMETLLNLWPRLTMAQLVYRNFETSVAEQGDTVNTRITDKFAARDADPDNFASNKPTATNVKVTMDKWKEVVFEIGDKESSLTMKRVYEEFLPSAGFALAQTIESALMARYVDLMYYSGAAGTPPNDVAKIGTNVKQRFDDLLIPRGDRRVVLSPAHENYFNQIFWKANETGSTAQQTTGELQTKFGMYYYGADLLPSHTAGTAAGQSATMNVVAALSASNVNNYVTTVTCSLAACGATKTLVPGDLLTIGTGANTIYGVVKVGGTSDGAGAMSGVQFVADTQAVKNGITGGTAVAITASHNVSMAFNQQCFALVSRPLRAPEFPGAQVHVANMNGIGVRSTLWYDPKALRQYVRLDLLFGTATIDARKGFRLIS